MAASLEQVLAQIHHWTSPRLGELADAVLLERFVQRHDESAFAALVARHGAMVLRSCRRIVGNVQDAEDAFQATFQILARKAHTLKQPEALTGWLHGVARRVALNARRKAAAGAGQAVAEELLDTQSDPLAQLTARELLRVLEEEVARLRLAQRSAVVLCCLEGRTQEEAARQLGWTAGSLKGHLERGRRRLQERLRRRGIALASALALVAVSRGEAASALLLRNTVVAALSGGISNSAAALAHSVLRTMFLSKLAVITVMLTAALAASATVVLVLRGPLAPTPEDQTPAVPIGAKNAEASKLPLRIDALDDPLPPGALVRLGSIRLRHLGATVMFSRDGKTLISAGADGTIRYWEPATGKEKRRVRVQGAASRGQPSIFAADGKTVAGTSSDYLHVWDADTGKELQRFPYEKIAIPGLEKRSAMLWRMAFSADGKMLAAQFDDHKERKLHLWNVQTGKEIFTWKVRQYRDDLEFSPDGKLLATVWHSEGIQLWDTATGKEVRKISGGQSNLAFTPDGKRVASISRNGGGVTVWNLANGKEIFALKPVAGRYPVWLTFAPDNKTLAISFSEGPVLYDIAAGKKLRTIGSSYYGRLVFSPDSKTAATKSGSSIHLWDVATGQELAARPGHESGVTSLAIAPDGGRIATFDLEPRFRVWDAASGRSLLHIAAHTGIARSGAFSPGGRFLVTGGGDEVLRAWDCEAGKEARKFTIESAKPANARWGVQVMALSSDGERVAALAAASGDVFQTLQVHVWDFATGKRLARRTLKQAGFRSRFSPDTRRMANSTRDGVIVTDTDTGRAPVKVTGHPPLAFSPDGQILAATLYRQKKPQPGQLMSVGVGGLPEDAEAIALTELATGKVLTRIEAGRSGFSLLAYSPDGRTLATADRDGFRIWDAATGRELFRRLLPEEYRGSSYPFLYSLAYFPSGDRLATGLLDGTVLIWDLQTKTWHAGLAVKDLAPRDLECLWADLAGEDAAKAHRAVWTLAAAPTQAVPFLKEHLHPAAALDARQVRHLIDDLDNPEFAVREAAQKKLASFGEQAEPALRHALEGKPSLETRKRLESLHNDAESVGRGIVHSPELVRTLRALRVLGQIGDREAQQLLQTLAAGDPAARSTRQAKAILNRLRR